MEFADAIVALEDLDRLEWRDDRFAYGETRTVTLGMAFQRVPCVVWTSRDEDGDDVCRVISARKATRREQERYHANDRELW